jgi:hypothetical protein
VLVGEEELRMRVDGREHECVWRAGGARRGERDAGEGEEPAATTNAGEKAAGVECGCGWNQRDE